MAKRFLDHSPHTVALVGMGPSIADLLTETLTQEFMPDFADEFWTINMASNMVHSDLVFWMDDLKDQERFKPGLMAVLRRRGTNVITSKAYPEILPNSYDFPLDKVGALAIDVFGKPYLNNGVAMAIAYALTRGVKIMKIYGADFSYPNRDYAESGRACVEAWIAVASARDMMQIQLCPKTSLFDSVLDKGVYGYSEQPIITLPNGDEYKYRSPGEVTAAYVAEDSSGKPSEEEKNDGIRGNVPGTESGVSDDSGDAPNGSNGADSTPPTGFARPGESLRDSGEAGRDEDGNSPGVAGG
ncbi:MAG TPA: hypothetical protein ENH62_01110 [Marinobacter sp.]|uniref:Uncharacterized protein n=1 Tax=marine sediment metagenome TaxID=412755 RepID=A0A0F9Q976_9ZZZZ|nr:hypothetical protein [Marinobacter sp.]